jgi:hypothetical protein
MQRPCEVCAAEAPRGHSPAGGGSVDAGQPGGRVARLLVGERIVALCDRHAKMVRSAGARSLAGLRRLFREVVGRRSLLPRRAALNRRVFPPRPEGRRMGEGRRAADGRE